MTKRQRKFKPVELVRTADNKKTLFKGDTTNWSYKLYINTEKIDAAKPTYHVTKLPEWHNEALLRK